MEVNLRAVVLDILEEIESNNEFSHIIINNALLKYQYLDSQTAVDSIEQEEQDYTTWKKNNMEYFNTVNQLVKENKKLTSKDLSKYIGF